MTTTIHNDAKIDLINAMDNCMRVLRSAGVLTEDQYGRQCADTDADLSAEATLAASILKSLQRIEFFVGK